MLYQLESEEFEKVSSSEEHQSFIQKLEEVWISTWLLILYICASYDFILSPYLFLVKI